MGPLGPYGPIGSLALAPGPPIITLERDQLHGRPLHGRGYYDVSFKRSGQHLIDFKMLARIFYMLLRTGM